MVSLLTVSSFFIRNNKLKLSKKRELPRLYAMYKNRFLDLKKP